MPRFYRCKCALQAFCKCKGLRKASGCWSPSYAVVLYLLCCRSDKHKPCVCFHFNCAVQRGQEKEAVEQVANQDDEPLQPYEQQRKDNIARNEHMLSQIQQGLHPGPQGCSQPHKVPRKEQDRPGSKGTQPSRQSAQGQGEDGQGKGAGTAECSTYPVRPTARQRSPAKPKSSSGRMATAECKARSQAPQSASVPVGAAAQAPMENGASAVNASIWHEGNKDVHPGSLEHATGAMDRKIQPHRTCKKARA